MTQSNHTPGPWVFRTFQNEGEECPRAIIETAYIKKETDDAETIFTGKFLDCDNDYANCVLAAEAPNILAALEALLSDITVYHEQNKITHIPGCNLYQAIDNARAASAKARGQ